MWPDLSLQKQLFKACSDNFLAQFSSEICLGDFWLTFIQILSYCFSNLPTCIPDHKESRGNGPARLCRGHYIKGKQCHHIKVANDNISLGSNQSNLFSFLCIDLCIVAIWKACCAIKANRSCFLCACKILKYFLENFILFLLLTNLFECSKRLSIGPSRSVLGKA